MGSKSGHGLTTESDRRGELIAGRFELGALAGRGGMGAVFRAIDRTTGAACALKQLFVESPAQLERFEREANVLSALSHPGIVAYLGHGLTEAGRPYLAMEWLD